MTARAEHATRSIGSGRSTTAEPTTLFLFAFDPRTSGIDVVPGFNELRYQFASPADLDRIRDERSAPAAAVNPEYHQQGDRCLLQLSGDELVGLSWVTSSPLAYLSHGVYYNLPDDTCYTYSSYASRAHNAIMCRALRDRTVLRVLHRERKRRLLTAINVRALPEIEPLRPYGYELVGHMHVWTQRGRLRLVVDVRQDFWCFKRRT